MQSQYVSVGKPNALGAVYKAPLGTTLPTTADGELDEAFVELGYVDENGLTNSNTPSSSDVKAWGGTIVLSYQEEKPDTFQFKLIESLNPEVAKVAYGNSNVTGSLATGITITANAQEQEENCYVFEMSLRGGVFKRIVVPDGKVAEVGDIVYVDNDVIGYDITISALPDTSNNTHYEYIKGPSSTTTDPDPSNP